MFKVTFSNKTVKRLKAELQKAYRRGDLRSVRRLSVLIMIGERRDMETNPGELGGFRVDGIPLVENLCDGRLEEFGIWKNARSAGPPEQNAKSASCGVGSKPDRKSVVIRPVVTSVLIQDLILPEVSCAV